MVRALAFVWLAACGSGERIDECDRLIAVVEQIGACPRLDRVQRLQIEQTVAALRDGLGKLEDIGFAKVPPEALNAARQSCVKQREDLTAMYAKSAPECLR